MTSVYLPPALAACASVEIEGEAGFILLHAPGRAGHGGAREHGGHPRRAQEHPRAAAERAPRRLHHLRQERRLPAPGVCLRIPGARNPFPPVATPAWRHNYSTGDKGIEYDPSKCVRCQRCVKICADVEMAEALTLRSRALEVQVTTGFDLLLKDSTCDLCGCCVSTCPTSALYERAAKGLGQAKDLVKVRTTCTYCGVGCQMDLNVNRRLNRVIRVTSEPGYVPNEGNLCVKGGSASNSSTPRSA